MIFKISMLNISGISREYCSILHDDFSQHFIKFLKFYTVYKHISINDFQVVE